MDTFARQVMHFANEGYEDNKFPKIKIAKYSDFAAGHISNNATGGIMKTQLITLMAALSLASLSTQAWAGEASARVDTHDCGVPEYKQEWQADEETGEVVVAFKVDPSGKVKDVKLVASSGYPDLDSASVRTIKRCVFKSGVSAAPAASSAAWESVKVSWVLK